MGGGLWSGGRQPTRGRGPADDGRGERGCRGVGLAPPVGPGTCTGAGMRPVLQSWTSVCLLLASLLGSACAPEDEEVEPRVLLTGGNSGGGPVFNTHALDDHPF